MRYLDIAKLHHHRLRAALIAIVAAGGLTLAIVGAWDELHGRIALDQAATTTSMILESWRSTVLIWPFWIVVVVLVTLEWRFPARKGEGLVHKGAAQDVVYFVGFAVLQLTVVRFYFVLLDGLARVTIPGVGDHLERDLGPAMTLVLVFVVADLLNWGTHVVNHRVPLFWHFHEVHHSQRSLSMLTVSRRHFVEAMIASTVAFVPVALLGASFRVLAATVTATLFFNYLQHSNIRTNLGPLRHVLVTPQSHRLHHSIDPAHHDTNFGVVFSVWDRIFRTRCHDDGTEYPATGVENPAFPLERSVRPTSLLTTFGRQLVYPFRASIRTLSERGGVPG